MSFFAFSRMAGRMRRTTIPKKDGGSFQILSFPDSGLEVHFSKKLGCLSKEELRARRDNLQVMPDSEVANRWHLCTYGANSEDENCWD